MQVTEHLELARLRRRHDLERLRHFQRPAGSGARRLDAHPRIERGELELECPRVGTQHAEVGDDGLRTRTWRAARRTRVTTLEVSAGGAKVQLRDEAVRRLLHHDEHLVRVARDLRGPACARQPHPGVRVVADYSAVEIPEAVYLRGTEEPHIDTTALQ